MLAKTLCIIITLLLGVREIYLQYPRINLWLKTKYEFIGQMNTWTKITQSRFEKAEVELGMMVHIYNLSTQKVGARVQGQPALQSKILYH